MLPEIHTLLRLPMFARFLTALVAGSLAISSARADPIAYEPFNYAPGTNLAGLNGGFGWTSPWTNTPTPAAKAQIVSQSLSYSAGAISINGGPTALRLTGPAAADIFGSRGFPSLDGPRVWMSLLFQTNAAAPANDNFFQVGLDNAVGAIPRASVGLGSPGGATPGLNEFFARSTIGSTVGPNQFTGDDAANNTTYFLVALLEKTNPAGQYNRVSLFVNPTNEFDPGTPDAVVNLASGLTSVKDLIFRLARLGGTDVYLVDEVRVGTSFADVITVVPEPATVAVFGLLAAGAFGIRRRRRATAA